MNIIYNLTCKETVCWIPQIFIKGTAGNGKKKKKKEEEEEEKEKEKNKFCFGVLITLDNTQHTL